MFCLVIANFRRALMMHCTASHKMFGSSPTNKHECQAFPLTHVEVSLRLASCHLRRRGWWRPAGGGGRWWRAPGPSPPSPRHPAGSPPAPGPPILQLPVDCTAPGPPVRAGGGCAPAGGRASTGAADQPAGTGSCREVVKWCSHYLIVKLGEMEAMPSLEGGQQGSASHHI